MDNSETLWPATCPVFQCQSALETVTYYRSPSLVQTTMTEDHVFTLLALAYGLIYMTPYAEIYPVWWGDSVWIFKRWRNIHVKQNFC